MNENFAANLELLTDSDKYNYIAYLLSDINSTSIKVAKYGSLSKTNLIENNEYGYACLIRAAKRVLDKIELENPTSTRITSKERVDTRLWDMVALREAIINAFVHNDFTGEVPPEFEIFPDRIEITSAGGLPECLSNVRNPGSIKYFLPLKSLSNRSFPSTKSGTTRPARAIELKEISMMNIK